MRRIIQVLGITILLGLFNISLQAQFDTEYTMTGLWEQKFIEFGGEEKAYFISRTDNVAIQSSPHSHIQLDYIASAEFGDIEICYTPIGGDFFHLTSTSILIENNRIGEDVCEIVPNPDYEEPQLMLHAADIFETYKQTRAIPEGTKILVSTIRPLTERPISFIHLDSNVSIYSYYRLRAEFHEEYQFGYHDSNSGYIEYYGTWRAVEHPHALFGFYLESITPNNRIHFIAQDYDGNLAQAIVYRTVGGRYGDGTAQAELRVCVSETPDSSGELKGLYETECTDIDNDAPFENYYQPIVISHSQMPDDALMNINITALTDVPITIDGILVGDSHIPNKPHPPLDPNFEYIGEWEQIPVINDLHNYYLYSDDPEAEIRLSPRWTTAFVIYPEHQAAQVGDIEFCSKPPSHVESTEFCRLISQDLKFDIDFGSSEVTFRNIGNGISTAGMYYIWRNVEPIGPGYWAPDHVSTIWLGWKKSSVNYGTEDEPHVIDSLITSEEYSMMAFLFRGTSIILNSGPQSTGTLRVCLDNEYQDTCQLVNLDDLADPGLSRFGLDGTTSHRLRIYLVEGVFDFHSFRIFE